MLLGGLNSRNEVATLENLDNFSDNEPFLQNEVSKWSQPYHPLYHPDTQSCVGYQDVPDVVECSLNGTVPEELSAARRICYCFDEG